MIGINLLPYHLRPVKRTPLPYMITAAILILSILGMASLWVGLQANIYSVKSDIKKKGLELDKLKPIVEENNKLVQQTERLADKIATIQEIAADRIIWSRQLFNLSRLTPDNFWYKGIAEKERSITELQKVMDPKSKKEVVKTVQVRRRLLEIQGFVIKGQDGNQDIYPLTFNLEKDPEFSSMFQLNLPKFQDTEFEGYQVRSFTLEYNIVPRPKSEDTSENNAAGSEKSGQGAKAPVAPAGEKK